MTGDPLELEIQEILYSISSDIGTLILEYGLPVARIEEWVASSIEASESVREVHS